MTPGGRYHSLQKIDNKTKRRKLDEGGFHRSVDVSVERMLFNQVLGSTVGDYVGPVRVYSQQQCWQEQLHILSLY